MQEDTAEIIASQKTRDLSALSCWECHVHMHSEHSASANASCPIHCISEFQHTRVLSAHQSEHLPCPRHLLCHHLLSFTSSACPYVSPPHNMNDEEF